MQDAVTQLYALAQEIVRRLIADIEKRSELGAGWAREPVLRRPSIMREWEEIVAECIATTGGKDATQDRPTSAPGTPADDHTLAATVGLVDDPAVDVRPRDVADKADNAGVAGAHAVDARTAPDADAAPLMLQLVAYEALVAEMDALILAVAVQGGDHILRHPQDRTDQLRDHMKSRLDAARQEAINTVLDHVLVYPEREKTAP